MTKRTSAFSPSGILGVMSGGTQGLALIWLMLGCSALDNVVVLPRCDNDADCTGVPVTNVRCLVMRCESQRCVETVIDRDADGFADAECADDYCTHDRGVCRGRDCDDDNPAVHPEAPELCNGQDDNCNGLLDGPDEDDDADGHADTCAGTMASDCDDSDPDTYVGAPERCNGVDNDCLVGGVARVSGGLVLEPDEDRDGDGHASPTARCESLDASDFPKDDCNESNAAVFPGGPELCDNLDNDCNRIPDDYREGEPGSSCLPIDLTAGDTHTCVRMLDQSATCWGDSGYLLGATLVSDPEVPAVVRVPGGERYIGLAAGDDGSCGVLDNGRVRCWGPAELVVPELGESFPRRVGVIEGIETATQVVASLNHACAIVDEGVVCWGAAESGAVDGVLGRAPSQGPFLVAQTEGASDVDTSVYHSCAVVEGRVRCWGDPSTGALGGTPQGTERAVWAEGIDDAVEVAVGHHFTCVRHVGGEVSCFGDALYHNSPCRDCPDASTPRRVGQIDNAVSIDAHNLHACVSTDEGRVLCWGDNRHGQLGDGDLVMRPESEPLLAPGIDVAEQVQVGSWHTCVLQPNGVKCWGLQTRHRLGDGRSGVAIQRAEPREVSAIVRPAQIVAGEQSTCFRMPDLTLRCSGVVGEVFDSCYGSELQGWGAVLDVSVAIQGMCAVTAELVPADGGLINPQVRCAGLELIATYVRAAGQDQVVHLETEPIGIAVGQRHACALDSAGDVWCWGSDVFGQLGSPDAVDTCRLRAAEIPCSLTPLYVELQARATALVAGANHVCALLADGRAQCWGANSEGQLGRSPISPINGVGFVDGLPPEDRVIGLAAAGGTTCAVLQSRQAWCWGESPLPQPASLSPQHLPELGSVEQLAVANGGSGIGLCARLSTGSVWCVGSNEFGRLGGEAEACDEVACPRIGVPVTSLFDDAVDIACGDRHCCATRLPGQVRCWGDGRQGQAADGDVRDSRWRTRSTVDLVAFSPTEQAPACVEAGL